MIPYQFQKPLDKESIKTSTISFNKQTAEAKGLFPIFKPKPTPKKKKKITALLYKGAKKKVLKLKQEILHINIQKYGYPLHL